MESAEDALHGLEDARRLERLHDEILRAGLDGSTTRACWPMALHMRIFRVGMFFTISRTASIPPCRASRYPS